MVAGGRGQEDENLGLLRNRARNLDRARRKMSQSGAGLKKIELLRTSHKKARRRGGVREV